MLEDEFSKICARIPHLYGLITTSEGKASPISHELRNEIVDELTVKGRRASRSESDMTRKRDDRNIGR